MMSNKIDDERFELSTGLCMKIRDDGGYKVPPPRVIARTLEGLYDGLQLNILMYPEEFSRKQANHQIRAYLASVFPDHFDEPEF